MNLSSVSEPGDPLGVHSLSFVVVARDEGKTIRLLFDEILEARREKEDPWEVLFVDDGSRDGTWGAMMELADSFPELVRAYRLDEGVGRTAAQAFGLREARGEFIVTLDADMQDDPAMASRLLERMKGDFDVVCGWRRKRKDGWLKSWGAAMYNHIANFLTAAFLNDRNCSMRCFKRESFEHRQNLFHVHRLLPSLGKILGLRVSEVEVEHRPRRFGKSHFRPFLIFRRLQELAAIYFMRDIVKRPGPLFTVASLIFAVAGLLIGAAAYFLPLDLEIQGWLYPIAATLGGTAMVLGAVAFVGGFSARRVRGERTPVTVAATVGIGLMETGDSVLIPAGEEEQEFVLPEKKRALVADDDPAILILMEEFLTREGWEVRTALTLKEAVQAFDSSMHVAFLDVHMPEANSIELLDRLHQRSPGTRLISFTGDRDAQLGVEAFRRGASDFLRKPIQFEQVIAAANAAFGASDRARDGAGPAFSGGALPEAGSA